LKKKGAARKKESRGSSSYGNKRWVKEPRIRGGDIKRGDRGKTANEAYLHGEISLRGRRVGLWKTKEDEERGNDRVRRRGLIICFYNDGDNLQMGKKRRVLLLGEIVEKENKRRGGGERRGYREKITDHSRNTRFKRLTR